MTQAGRRPAARAGRRPPARTGRRAGDSGTREAILAAARQRFADYGYDGATIRGIAGDAGVDPALVHHFYGTKERLFAAAMQLPIVPGEVLTAALTADRDPSVSLGDHLARTALTTWDTAQLRATFLGLLRSAVTSERAAAMLREFVTATIMGPVARAARAAQAGGETAGSAADTARSAADLEYRAAMVASQMLGVAMTRYVLALGPVATASVQQLAATLGPTLDRYLTGDIRPGTQPPDGPPPDGSTPDDATRWKR
ncbi:MAG: TetR family transcriptional regulator [Streptosporangiaceae bacterium]